MASGANGSGFFDWVRSNVAVVVSWTVAVGVGIATVSTTVAAIHHQQAATDGRVAAVAEDVEENTTALVRTQSDVRLLNEQQQRMEQVVTRQESVVRDMERVTIEMKTVITDLKEEATASKRRRSRRQPQQ